MQNSLNKLDVGVRIFFLKFRALAAKLEEYELQDVLVVYEKENSFRTCFGIFILIRGELCDLFISIIVLPHYA